MTLNISTTLIVAAVCIIWLLASYSVYRFYASMDPKLRDWMDSTRTRRIAWVISGPIYWIFYVLFVQIARPLWEATSEYRSQAPERKAWREHRKGERQNKRKARRRAFLNDSEPAAK